MVTSLRLLAAAVAAAGGAFPSAHATEVAPTHIAGHGDGTSLVFGDCHEAMQWTLSPAAPEANAALVLIEAVSHRGPAPLCVSGTSALSLAPCNESDTMQQ